ncbi:hypothetical protein PPACK8108_LOCUS21000 [Phakopsora pachyrhizi]|uniref:Uncharacterized protein n=1 Tax=Phakopsora pachyrhizi TaxID=170000 RepID=A0AAV0BJ55_PHAPC|nr:hypothetical protein PPACK8108_LOCUS21000 [Phakopsora pachyrhizi]
MVITTTRLGLPSDLTHRSNTNKNPVQNWVFLQGATDLPANTACKELLYHMLQLEAGPYRGFKHFSAPKTKTGKLCRIFIAEYTSPNPSPPVTAGGYADSKKCNHRAYYSTLSAALQILDRQIHQASGLFIIHNQHVDNMIPVEGDHQGAHLAKIYSRFSRILNSNATMASTLQDLADGTFGANNNILGCVAHAINPAAKVAFEKFGNSLPYNEDIDESDEYNWQSMGAAQMSFANLVLQPNSESINLNLELSKISFLAKAINKSCQMKELFLKYIELYEEPETASTKCKGLVFNVKTQWNSTYSMLGRAHLHRKSYNQMCLIPADPSVFRTPESCHNVAL